MRDFGSGRVLLIRNELTSQFGFIAQTITETNTSRSRPDWSSAVKRC